MKTKRSKKKSKSYVRCSCKEPKRWKIYGMNHWPICLVRIEHGDESEAPIWVWGSQTMDGIKLAQKLCDFLNRT